MDITELFNMLLVAVARSRPSLAAFLEAASIISFRVVTDDDDSNFLEFILGIDNDFYRANLKEKDNIVVINEVFSDVFRVKTLVRVERFAERGIIDSFLRNIPDEIAECLYKIKPMDLPDISHENDDGQELNQEKYKTWNGLKAKRAVYISYAWGDAQETGTSREDIVNRLYDSLLADGYDIKRDKMDLGYKGLISEFMHEIGRSDCIVVVISDKYLKSPFCMYELLAIHRQLKFDKRVCPIVLSDAKLSSLADRLEYVAHWQAELARIEQLIAKVGFQMLSSSGSLQEYEKYKEITFQADQLFTYLADINSQTLKLIEANDFETLKRAIDERLQQLQ